MKFNSPSSQSFSSLIILLLTSSNPLGIIVINLCQDKGQKLVPRSSYLSLFSSRRKSDPPPPPILVILIASQRDERQSADPKKTIISPQVHQKEEKAPEPSNAGFYWIRIQRSARQDDDEVGLQAVLQQSDLSGVCLWAFPIQSSWNLPENILSSCLPFEYSLNTQSITYWQHDPSHDPILQLTVNSWNEISMMYNQMAKSGHDSNRSNLLVNITRGNNSIQVDQRGRRVGFFDVAINNGSTEHEFLMMEFKEINQFQGSTRRLPLSAHSSSPTTHRLWTYFHSKMTMTITKITQRIASARESVSLVRIQNSFVLFRSFFEGGWFQ